MLGGHPPGAVPGHSTESRRSRRDGPTVDAVTSRSDRPLRVEVDFNYGAFSVDTGVAYLSPKRGDRTGMDPRIRDQFTSVGVEPSHGMVVVLVDPGADEDKNGAICDMEVVATLAWIDDGHGWRAVYDPTAMSWIPSKGREAPS